MEDAPHKLSVIINFMHVVHILNIHQVREKEKKKKREALKGTAVYSCYDVSDDNNQLSLVKYEL